MEQRTRIVAAVLKAIKLPPRFQLKLVKEDPVRLELILTPAYGFGWTLSGWLLTPFMAKAGMETVGRMRQRVLAGLLHSLRGEQRKIRLQCFRAAEQEHKIHVAMRTAVLRVHKPRLG